MPGSAIQNQTTEHTTGESISGVSAPIALNFPRPTGVSEALQKLDLDIGRINAQGLDAGILSSFANGVGTVTISPLSEFRIMADTRAAPEYSTDRVSLRGPAAPGLPKPGQLIVFQPDERANAGDVARWCTGVEYSRPSMPSIRTFEEYSAEARYLLPHLSRFAGVTFPSCLPIPEKHSSVADALRDDMQDVISRACAQIACPEAKGLTIRSVEKSFGSMLPYIHDILLAKPTFDALAPGSQKTALEDRIINAYTFIEGLERGTTSSLHIFKDLDMNERRALSEACTHVKRAAHLLLHGMGIKYA